MDRKGRIAIRRKVAIWALTVVLLATLALTLAGCGQSSDVPAIKGTVQSYITALMGKQFDQALSYTTGSARYGLSAVKDELIKSNYTDTVHKLAITVNSVDEKSGYATAVASYELQEDIPGAGTSWDKTTMHYDLSLINGKWFIYKTTVVDKNAMK